MSREIFVIRDTKMECDTFVFLADNDGAASSYFYNWAMMQQHRDFVLESIGLIIFDGDEQMYQIADNSRRNVCSIPKDEANA